MKRSILHVDCNNFFASVESVYEPSLREVPFVVTGRSEERHGIVLAKNELAKKYDIKTGETLWQAKKKCPQLRTVEPHFDRYNKFSKLFKGICFEYTDLLESFGIDECWLDVTGNRKSAIDIAEEIRERVKNCYGITVSVGVSFNKVFAKLASDLKKPDAVTIIDEENFRSKVWGLPAEDMLGVGRATLKCLHAHGVRTIGEIAAIEPEILKVWLGKGGTYLWKYANGLDDSRVMRYDEKIPPKSVSSGYTPYRNLENENDVRILIYALSENIASQLRKHSLCCRTVSIFIRDTSLKYISRQCALEREIADSAGIAEKALGLFRRTYNSDIPVRSITVCASELVPYSGNVQLDFSGEAERDEHRESINRAVDMIRRRYGYSSVCRAVIMQDKRLGMFDPKEIGDAHPVGVRN
ncbi:MAG: DNA polymerase IV [Ruminococcus flavefaciens]|jgi:DNA polymerase-4|nr:DNA polymerase IV [Ruminococcus flavefaciens]